MSESIDQITAALSAFQGEVEQPSLNKSNPYFKSRYVDLSGILKVVQPILAKNGLFVSQIISGDELITLLSHKSGQWIKSQAPIGAYKNAQDRGSALTYIKRYALSAILGIAADTDDDGNAAAKADDKAQLKKALAEINAVNNDEEWLSVWNKWTSLYNDFGNPGTTFYNAAGAKRNTLAQQPAR